MAENTQSTGRPRTPEQEEAQQELIKVIKEIRAKRGSSHQKFADDLGISLRGLEKIENGKNIPNGHTISSIIGLFGMDYELSQKIISLAKTAGSKGIEKLENKSPQLGGIIYFLLPKLDGRFWPGFLTTMMLKEAQLSPSVLSHSRAPVNMEFLLSVSCHEEDWWQLHAFLTSIENSYFKTKGIIVAPPRAVIPDPGSEEENRGSKEEVGNIIKSTIQCLRDMQKKRSRVLVLDRPFYTDSIDEPSDLELIGFRDKESGVEVGKLISKISKEKLKRPVSIMCVMEEYGASVEQHRIDGFAEGMNMDPSTLKKSTHSLEHFHIAAEWKRFSGALKHHYLPQYDVILCTTSLCAERVAQELASKECIAENPPILVTFDAAGTVPALSKQSLHKRAPDSRYHHPLTIYHNYRPEDLAAAVIERWTQRRRAAPWTMQDYWTPTWMTGLPSKITIEDAVAKAFEYLAAPDPSSVVPLPVDDK